MKGLDEAYIDLQLRWLKMLGKRQFGNGESVTYGESDKHVYFGTSWYLIRVPKQFGLFDKEALARLYPVAFRQYPTDDIFTKAVNEAIVFAYDTGLRREKEKNRYVALKTEDEVYYHVNDKFFAMLKDFDITGYCCSGKEYTPVIVKAYGEPLAMALPTKLKV